MASSCYAYPNPIFQPAMRLIASITNANPALVTTTFAHQYKTGLIVRLDLPLAVGMYQANGMQGVIAVVDATSFYISINTTTFDLFAIPPDPTPPSPPDHINRCAQVVPVGEVNEQLDQATRNVLPFGPL
jgi:hypothetical protein